MEVKIIQCPNGHHYNPSMYAACPECGAKGQNFPKTTPPGAMSGNAGGAFPKTEPLRKENSGNPIGPTMPAGYDVSTPVMPDWNNKTFIGGQYASEEVVPVVGWLVCIKGELRGVDFRIHEGYNYIGREEGDIHIHGDNAISRQKAASVLYDGETNSFYAAPVENRNVIKLNGAPLVSVTPIKNYDVISFGKTVLMLVALCGEHFHWDEVEEK